MTTFRTATDEYTVPDDFYTPAAAYSPDAGPGQDDRRDQLDTPGDDLERVEPEADPDTAELPTDRRPVPYYPEPAPADGTSAPERRPDDGLTRTVTVGDSPVVVLSEDAQRRSWTVWVNSTSAAGVRLATGRHAAEDADASPTSIPLDAGATLTGTMTGRLALVTDTPGTAATVHVVAERDGIA